MLGSAMSVDRYRRVLQAFYGFYEPLEQQLARVARASPPLGFPLAERSVLLARDLVELGTPSHDISELPRCGNLPALSRCEHLAGCLYVIEGASLGGQIIARALARNLGVTKGGGGAFFFGDGERTAGRWKRVLRWLDEVASSGAFTDDVVSSACETFRALARWTKDRGAGR